MNTNALSGGSVTLIDCAKPSRSTSSVFRPPYERITPVLTLYGLAWGLVNFGFLVWLPIYVSKLGVSAGQVTTVLAKARACGLTGVDGLGMLLYQGAIAFERWTGRDAPVDVMRDALTSSAR